MLVAANSLEFIYNCKPHIPTFFSLLLSPFMPTIHSHPCSLNVLHQLLLSSHILLAHVPGRCPAGAVAASAGAGALRCGFEEKVEIESNAVAIELSALICFSLVLNMSLSCLVRHCCASAAGNTFNMQLVVTLFQSHEALPSLCTRYSSAPDRDMI